MKSSSSEVRPSWERIPRAPASLLLSIEADVFPKNNPADSILIEGAIGERSFFHQRFGYYAHGVDETTAILPEGWRERLVAIRNKNTRGATGWCLEVHDLAVSKLAAGREKDLDFVETLARMKLVQVKLVRQRLAQTKFADPTLERLSHERCERLSRF